MNQSYISEDAWKIVETGFNPDRVKASESIFSIGNGAMGQRANFEEHYSGPSFQGSYIGGIYYPDKTKVGWWKNGYPDYFAKVINAPNWIGIDITVDQIPLDLFTSKKILQFTRVLDMKTGLYSRSYELEMPNGIQLKASVKRFLSMKEGETGAIEYNIELLSEKASFDISPYLNGKIKNEDSNWDDPFWNHLEAEVNDQSAFLLSKTLKTEFHVCSFMHAELSLNGNPLGDPCKNFNNENKLGFTTAINLSKGDQLTITKYGGYVTSLHHDEHQLKSVAKQKISSSLEKGFQSLYDDHSDCWSQIWALSDIVIGGDLNAQQGIRFNIFQLNQTYTGRDDRLNIGPKGFTGEKYGGSAYWDTEAYCLPFYMTTKGTEVAKNLLKYRFNQLPKAIENAEKLGFNGGAALFPMVTMNGEECHNEWEITFEEIHRNGAIAYAIYNYENFTNDTSYIPEKGLEVLIAISRFWSQRVNFSNQKNKYVILGVTGPNEYENNVDNNWYTNYIARWTLKYTINQIHKGKTQWPEQLQNTTKKTNLKEEEIDRWLEITEKMYLPFDAKHNVYLQQDGFLDKEMMTVDQLDDDQRPINQNWSWDRILRSPFIKQADTLQGFYFFEDDFTHQELEDHYNFYKPFTLHESSLSPCIHSILAVRLDKMKEAYELYLRTSRLDLDDYNREVEEGLHITSMAGTWMSVVNGFVGLKIKEGMLSLKPKLPQHWNSLSLKINYRGAVLTIHHENNDSTFQWSGEKPLDLLLNDHPITVNSSKKLNPTL